MGRTALPPDEIAAFRLRAAAVATTLFARRGYDAMTMRAVADALGVSAMTPYRYLEGKPELFALVRAHAFRTFADYLDDAATAADPIERLHRLKTRYVRFALDHADAYRIMFELQQPTHVDSSREAKRAFGCLLGAVTYAIDAGALEGDPLTVAQLLWASTHGLVSLHLAGRLSARVLEQLAAVDHELAGFRPTGKPRRRS
jgi:AcrR family transcriptional regulator